LHVEARGVPVYQKLNKRYGKKKEARLEDREMTTNGPVVERGGGGWFRHRKKMEEKQEFEKKLEVGTTPPKHKTSPRREGEGKGRGGGQEKKCEPQKCARKTCGGGKERKVPTSTIVDLL